MTDPYRKSDAPDFETRSTFPWWLMSPLLGAISVLAFLGWAVPEGALIVAGLCAIATAFFGIIPVADPRHENWRSFCVASGVALMAIAGYVTIVILAHGFI